MRSATRKRTGKDKAYLAFLHEMPCAIEYCAVQSDPKLLMGVSSFSEARTEAAHVGPRGLSQKCPDRQAIPLCIWHHRTGPSSHHSLQKLFWSFHGLDRDALIAQYNRKFEEQA